MQLAVRALDAGEIGKPTKDMLMICQSDCTTGLSTVPFPVFDVPMGMGARAVFLGP